MSRFCCVLLLVIAVRAGRVAYANDGALDWSGSPRLMNGHPTVQMQSEVVRLSIGKDTVITDCRFVFVNHGKACRVRVGFPDDSIERAAGGYEGLPPSGFLSFRSWVDGKEVSTQQMRGPTAGGEGTLWRAKTVAFAARGHRGSTRTVRERYVTAIGGEMTFLAQLAGYTLHTGSSWHGPIGRSEISVIFERAPNRVLQAVPLSKIRRNPRLDLLDDHAAVERLSAFMKKWGNVVYSGPGRAAVRDNTLRWARTNWRPTAADDITLWFKMP